MDEARDNLSEVLTHYTSKPNGLVKWAPTFTAWLLKMNNKAQKVSYFNWHVTRYDKETDWEMNSLLLGLIPYHMLPVDESYPRDSRPKNAYIPRRAISNGAVTNANLSEAMQSLGIKGDAYEITSLRQAIKQYIGCKTNGEGQIVCKLAPYLDCLGVPLSLLLAEENNQIVFELISWKDTDNTPSGDIGYSMRHTMADKKEFYFGDLKPAMTSIIALAHKDEKYSSSAKAYNFQGAYPVKDKKFIELKDKGICDSLFVAEDGTMTSTEEEMILSLANGDIDNAIVIPTLQGYFWAVECGLTPGCHGEEKADLEGFPLLSLDVDLKHQENHRNYFGFYVKHQDEGGSDPTKGVIAAFKLWKNIDVVQRLIHNKINTRFENNHNIDPREAAWVWGIFLSVFRRVNAGMDQTTLNNLAILRRLPAVALARLVSQEPGYCEPLFMPQNYKPTWATT